MINTCGALIAMLMKQIYRITYPNGKIYIGKDLTGTLTYFGSVDPNYVAKDFSEEEKKNFTITKKILWESENVEDSIVNKKEIEFIQLYNANDPHIGYNQWPKFSKNDPNEKIDIKCNKEELISYNSRNK